jgi:serine/threonine protein kinase
MSGTDPVQRGEEVLTPPQAFERIISADFDFRKELFPAVSEDAVDLIQKCLILTSEDRITMEQMLAHPWIYNEREIILLPQLEKIKKRYKPSDND